MSTEIKTMIVHNSDQIKNIFISYTDMELLDKIRNSSYWEDIVNRLVGDIVDNEEGITLDIIDSDLYHDGDSEDGYSYFTTEL